MPAPATILLNLALIVLCKAASLCPEEVELGNLHVSPEHVASVRPAPADSYTLPGPGETWKLASAVVDIEVLDRATGRLLEVSGLQTKDEVDFALKAYPEDLEEHLRDEDGCGVEAARKEITCEWHDQVAARWSPEGCRVVDAVAATSRVACSCSHLTRFALILRSYRAGDGCFEVRVTWSNYIFAFLYLFTCAMATWQIKRMFRDTKNPFVRQNFSLAVGSGVRGGLQLAQGVLYSHLALGVLLTGIAYASIFGVFCHTSRSIETDPFASLRPLFYLSYVANALLSVGIPLAILAEDREGQIWLARVGSYGMAFVTIGMATCVLAFGFKLLAAKGQRSRCKPSVLRSITVLALTFSVQGSLWAFSVSEAALDRPILASQLDVLFNVCVLAGLWPMLRLTKRDKQTLVRALTARKLFLPVSSLRRLKSATSFKARSASKPEGPLARKVDSQIPPSLDDSPRRQPSILAWYPPPDAD